MQDIIRKCDICGKDMVIKVVRKKGSKNYGEIIKIHQNKRFCSKKCQIEWQKDTKWEDRVGEEVASRIRIETSKRVSGDKNPSTNKEIANKISESIKKYLSENPRKGEKNPMWGKNHTEEYKKWASESRKGKWSYNEEQFKKQNINTPKGENHPNWNGGTSYLPYDKNFNNKLKKKIKELDKKRCSICSKKTQKLVIHHIDYNKLNSTETNLVSLCISCHSKTNYNRNNWVKFFECYVSNNRVINEID